MNKKFIFVAIGILLLLGSVSAQDKSLDKTIQTKLVGVWQASPSVGSGMNDNFQFFADGKFRFNYNQMDGTKRILSYGGNWKVSDDKLILTLEKMTVLIGGKWIKSSGSIATEYEIEGGEVLELKISPAKEMKLNIGKFIQEELHETLEIDGIKYWKLSSDPKTYEN